MKLFADRLEIRSPGGLYGDVTVDTLEEAQSTRNRRLMQLLEYQHLVENRGSGIDSMIAEMRDAHMEPPRFRDDRSTFTVTFLNHTLLITNEGLGWLNTVAADLQLNERQKLALLYLRANARMTNNDYRRLHRVDSRVASRELQELVAMGAAHMRGVRGGAHYVLALPAVAVERQTEPVGSQEQRVLAFVGRNGSITNSQCRELLHIDSRDRVQRLLGQLVDQGRLERVGERRGARYVLPKDAADLPWRSGASSSSDLG